MKPMGPADQLVPTEISAAVKAGDLRHFLTLYGDTLILLVRLRPDDPDLANGLWSTVTRGADKAAHGAGSAPLEFHTVIQPSRRMRPPDAASPKRLASLLEAAMHFAVPLRKRANADMAFEKRISVGRTLNKDVVLRNGSVSKFHGWFEQDDEGDFSFADAGSKNSTMLNGVALAPRKATRVDPGNLLRFGNVETILCSPEEVYAALR
jgi:FHA domain